MGDLQRLLDDGSLSDRTSLDVATIVRLLRFCLTSTSFLYRGQHYQQLDGVAMGSLGSACVGFLNLTSSN